MSGIARGLGCGALLLGLLGGCGGEVITPGDPGPPPPHGGELVLMPGGQGHVEVVRRAGASGGAAFYFLKAGNAPMSPAPRAGVLAVGSKRVTLEAEGGGLVTPDGSAPFPKGELDGVLSVELGGQSVNIPLGAR